MSQLLRWLSRAAPLGMEGAFVPMIRPVTTTARTPEAWIASAGRYADEAVPSGTWRC